MNKIFRAGLNLSDIAVEIYLLSLMLVAEIKMSLNSLEGFRILGKTVFPVENGQTIFG